MSKPVATLTTTKRVTLHRLSVIFVIVSAVVTLGFGLVIMVVRFFINANG